MECATGSSLRSGIGRPITLCTAPVHGRSDTIVGGGVGRDVKELVICEYEFYRLLYYVPLNRIQ